jgi:UDP-N-acetyl-2-amino-2-deoxyglucuronate dehydrogenase
MTYFALIGASGYIAPRHLQAIKAVGGTLRAAVDPSDSVGIIDSFFPNAHFFTEFERFDRHIDKLRRRQERIDYVSICSPNYLHDAHCRFALRSEATAICEKPLVLNPWNIDGLAEIEADTGRRIFTILQLRHHAAIRALKARVEESDRNDFAVDLTYITARGRWYHASWKGRDEKSGGVATNIGIHFFDMLSYVFGPLQSSTAHLRDHERAAGYLEFKRARVRWFLSIDSGDLPESLKGKKTTYRSFNIDGEEVEFSDGFADLHIRSYEEILAGRGFGLDQVRPSVELVSAFRGMVLTPSAGEPHPFVARYPAP